MLKHYVSLMLNLIGGQGLVYGIQDWIMVLEDVPDT